MTAQLYPMAGQGLVLKEINEPWREVLHLGVKRQFARGSRLEGAHGSEVFFFIHSGRIRMTYSNEAGQTFLFSYLGAGTLCADAMIKAASRKCLFMCVTPVEVWEFEKSLLFDKEFLCRYPHLFQNLLQSATVKLIQTFNHACSVAVHTPMQRLCAFLYCLMLENATPDISHEELANYLGMHRSSLSRGLASLREQGILGAFSKKRLEILNPTALAELARKAPVVSMDHDLFR